MAVIYDERSSRVKLTLALAGRSSAGTKKLGQVLQRVVSPGSIKYKPETFSEASRVIEGGNVQGHLNKSGFIEHTRPSTWQHIEQPFSVRLAQAPVKDKPRVVKPRANSPFKKTRKPFILEVK